MANVNASIISTGLITTGDATGNLQLQSDGTTGLTVIAGGKLLIANTGTVSTARTGQMEYDGGELYFTPLGTQRGLVPNMQYFRLNTTLVGSNATGAQNILGVGATLSSNTVYAFELCYNIIKSAGTTSHTVSQLFGGTATLNNISYQILSPQSQTTGTVSGAPATTVTYGLFIQQATATVVSGAIAVSNQAVFPLIKGTVSVNAGGTFIPQYSLSAAPGGAYTTQIGSYMCIWPIGSSGANTSIGTWA